MIFSKCHSDFSRFVMGAFVVAGASSCQTMSRNSAFELSSTQESRLKNGIETMLINDSSLPATTVMVLVRHGMISESPGKSGVTELVGSTIDKGSGGMSANQISETFASMGGDFSISIEPDYMLVTLKSLSFDQERLIRFAYQVLSNPTFADDEIQRAKKRLTTSIRALLDQPSAVASAGLNQMVFGEHPYGRAVFGSRESLGKIRRGDIVNRFNQLFRPEYMTVAVVGRLNESLPQVLDETFGGWKQRVATNLHEVASPKESPRGEITFVKKSDLTQSQVRFGHLSIARNDPRFMKVRIANSILGHGFTSRLMDEIRDNMGLTYTIQSDVSNLRHTGIFHINTFTQNQRAGLLITEARRLYEDFVKGGVTQEELDSAKAYLKGLFPQVLETVDGQAFNRLILKVYGIEQSYLTDFMKDLDTLKLSEVNDVIRETFFPDRLKVFVLGGEGVEDQLNLVGKVNSIEYSEFIKQF